MNDCTPTIFVDDTIAEHILVDERLYSMFPPVACPTARGPRVGTTV